mmetsp:Transcript_38359/g.93162  ORF Transcript_38359/g.93162 Transcript_38359/m.93162 type:complete len:470 (+) Transcript_38359:309-1718(+)
MFDFLCCKMPCLVKSCAIRTVFIVGVVFLILWIVSLFTSDPATVIVPPIADTAKRNAQKMPYFGEGSINQNNDSTTDDQIDRHSIVIVGGGAAGLFAGYTLKYLGIDDFVILEAHPSLYGGRVRQFLPSSNSGTGTVIDSDVPIDLGAEWIHCQPRILADLLLYDEDRQTISSSSSPSSPKTIVYQPQTYDTFSVSSGRRSSRDWFRFFYAEYKFYNTTWFGYLERFVYPYVVSHLQLDTAVWSIDYTDTSTVTLTTTRGSVLHADKVILAVPITALQDGYSNKIEFLPELPSWKQTSIDKIQIADGMKLWLEFDEAFYSDMVIRSSLFGYINDDPMLYFNTVFRKPSTKHILTQFLVGGPDSDRVRLTDEEAVQVALDDLDQIYDGRASQLYTGRYLVQNWSKEEFIQGAYPINYNDFWDDMPNLQQSVDNRLYFAGSYMHEETTTVHGAALSGRRAVEKLLLDLDVD